MFQKAFGQEPPKAIYDSIVEIHSSAGEAPREFYAMMEAYTTMIVE